MTDPVVLLLTNGLYIITLCSKIVRKTDFYKMPLPCILKTQDFCPLPENLSVTTMQFHSGQL